MWRVVKRVPQHWLMKSEPDVYSIDDLARDGVGTWEGVRNYQARNYMRSMHVGDLALFYHSNAKPPGVVGVMRIAREAYVDDTQFDPASAYYDAKVKAAEPRWDRVDVAFVERLPCFVTLDELRTEAALSEMLVIRRGMRLSVQPVTPAEFAHVRTMGGARARR